jgi:hypothetical protein
MKIKIVDSYRDRKGRYASIKKTRKSILILYVLNFAIGGTMYFLGSFNRSIPNGSQESHDLAHPEEVQAVNQVEPTPTPEPTPEPVEGLDPEIRAYIIEVFGEVADEAIRVAKCESTFETWRIGDTDLMIYDSKHDEMVGDSIGFFQIRTGGNGWNRARANGLTAEQFRVKLKEYKYNIDYAKTIYDRTGWRQWSCKP